ncbi:MAG TPA: hypothetical protein VFZ53_12355, partial [Polyangiaceae bacterium]
MARRSSRRALWINVAGVAAALIVAVFGLSGRFDGDVPDAWAQPRSRPGVSLDAAPLEADAGSDAAPAVTEAGAEGTRLDEPSGASPPDPIDVAVAPDGGVPYHPSGTPYRSPFARPSSERAVRVKVGMLLNSVDDYDVKTGTFLADFFLSFTSEKPMPKLSPQFPNGRVENVAVIA